VTTPTKVHIGGGAGSSVYSLELGRHPLRIIRGRGPRTDYAERIAGSSSAMGPLGRCGAMPGRVPLAAWVTPSGGVT